MICSTCKSQQFTTSAQMIYICDYCLMPRSNERLDTFLDEFKAAYNNRTSLTEVISRYDDITSDLRFPFVVRDFVNASYNQSIIISSLNLLPEHELIKLKEIISSGGEYEYSFESSLEYYNQLYEIQDREMDFNNELKFLLLLIANEQSKTKYQSLTDLKLLCYEPRINIIEKKFLSYYKNFNASFRRQNPSILSTITTYRKSFDKYYLDSTRDGIFETRDAGTDIVITSVKSKQKKVIIPPILKGRIVTEISESSILSLPAEQIIFPITLNNIPPYAVQDNKNLKYIKILGSTKFEPEAFIHCPELTHVDVDDNNQYTSIEGVIYTKNKNQLVYFPPALNKPKLDIAENVRVNRKSCYDARYLRDVEFKYSTQIEEDAFKLDHNSLLTTASIIKLTDHQPNSTSFTMSSIQGIDLATITKSSAERLLKTNKVTSIEDLFVLLDNFNEEEQVKSLQDYFNRFENENDRVMILDKLIQSKPGRTAILSLNINNPKHFYYVAKSLYDLGSTDYENILQLFLQSYNEGHQLSGLNAALMLKKGLGMKQDLLYAERILLDLSSKGNIEADRRLLLLYHENDKIFQSNSKDIDVFELIERLEKRNPDGYTALKAEMLYRGTIIERNLEKAIELFLDLANMNDADAAFQLGYIYSTEEQFKDYEKALLFYQNSYNLGRKDALREMEKVSLLKSQ